MSATIYHFPLKTFRGLKIPLYTEEEIYTTVLALNCFGESNTKVTEEDLKDIEPIAVVKALYEAKNSSFVAFKTKQLIDKILKSIETL